ncbi:alpha/beta hydrolase family protein [Pararhodobacter sp.]|uniref:alpha/beta hydrolase family protein n=1 Tax=Pararhodobacter sp. TaxID=2127056 RepID=UPI002FDE469F
MSQAEAIRIDSKGARLAGTLIAPPAPALAVMINAATGVPAAYYRPFAEWLSQERNAACLIWDYRDFGASGSIHGSQANMTDWGVTDASTARFWLRNRFPALPLWVIGHSLGGMTVPFQPGLGQIDRLITVAAGAGHVSDHPWPFQAQARALWYLLGPAAARLLGYLPGRALGLGNDLPAPVFRQWRRWCTDRRSLPGDPDLPVPERPGLVCPVKLVAIADDVMIPPAAVWRMGAWMPAATVSKQVITPADYGLTSVGHIAPFAARNRALWGDIIA